MSVAPNDLGLLEAMAAQDARWQPVLRAAKEIQAHLDRIAAENAQGLSPSWTCPWLARHLPPKRD